METWQSILAAGAAVAAALAWLRTTLRPYVPLLADLARAYIEHMGDVERRERLLMWVRAAEELLGPAAGAEKLAYVRAATAAEGYEFSDEEISAAARLVTKELGRPDEPLDNTHAPP